MAMRTELGRNTATARRLGKALLATGVALAMTPVLAGSWTITPTLAVTETATDNVALTDSGKRSDLISDISPGIHIEGVGGRSKLRFDYQMHNLIYAQDSSRNQIQNALNALGTLEAIEDWLFLEASGKVSQQSVSAFGSSSSSSSVNVSTNENTIETSSYRLSPYIVGSLGGFADYQLRYNLATTKTSSSASNDEAVSELVASLKGSTSKTNLGWSLDASTQRISYDKGRDNEADRLRGVLTYRINPEFRVSLIGGVEANNYQSLNKESNSIRGAGFDWSPTERTLLSVSREKRFFGQANAISFTHRTASTAWKFSDVEDVVTQTDRQSNTSLGTYYDLFFDMLSYSVPDETQRAALVSNMLLQAGIPLDKQVDGSFLTNGSTIQHRRDFSFALQGARNTVTFSAGQTQSERASSGALTSFLGVSDFANVQTIRQRFASINWSHKLTPMSSMIASVSRSNSKGSGTSGADLETTRQMYNLNLSTRLGPKTNASIGLRHVASDGTANYTENAVTGTLSHQF